MDEIIKAIFLEISRAEQLWPEWPEDKVYAAAIVSEEAGELLKEANNLRLAGRIDPDTFTYKKVIADMRKEAIQTAAMAIRFIKNMED